MKRQLALLILAIVLTGCEKTPQPETTPQSTDSHLSTVQNLSRDELARRTIERRAVEAAIWGMPIVAMDAVHHGFLRDMQANDNDIAYYSQLPDWKFQTTTPNASTH